MRGRSWFWKYSLKSLYFMFNFFILNHYSLFSSNSGVWRYNFKRLGKPSNNTMRRSIYFSKYSQWKLFHSPISSFNALTTKTLKN